uniref:Uncharacterized protein n=1 Tax=Trichogramma kaykai TaxID=54128 RepID=A0ABD2WTD0_9HYME
MYGSSTFDWSLRNTVGVDLDYSGRRQGLFAHTQSHQDPSDVFSPGSPEFTQISLTYRRSTTRRVRVVKVVGWIGTKSFNKEITLFLRKQSQGGTAPAPASNVRPPAIKYRAPLGVTSRCGVQFGKISCYPLTLLKK